MPVACFFNIFVVALTRWRQLGGEDPDPDQIAEKIEVLEQRLSQVKQQILEKDLVLEEVTALSNRLESEASKDRGSTLRRARDVNSFQVRIREVRWPSIHHSIAFILSCITLQG